MRDAAREPRGGARADRRPPESGSNPGVRAATWSPAQVLAGSRPSARTLPSPVSPGRDHGAAGSNRPMLTAAWVMEPGHAGSALPAGL